MKSGCFSNLCISMKTQSRVHVLPATPYFLFIRLNTCGSFMKSPMLVAKYFLGNGWNLLCCSSRYAALPHAGIKNRSQFLVLIYCVKALYQLGIECEGWLRFSWYSGCPWIIIFIILPPVKHSLIHWCNFTIKPQVVQAVLVGPLEAWDSLVHIMPTVTPFSPRRARPAERLWVMLFVEGPLY